MLQMKSVAVLKQKLRHFKTHWWNKNVDVAVRRKRELFRISKQSRNEEVRKKYCSSEHDCESKSLGGSGDG